MQKYYKFIKLSNKQEKNMRTLPIIVASVSPITLASASPITVASASPLVCTPPSPWPALLRMSALFHKHMGRMTISFGQNCIVI